MAAAAQQTFDGVAALAQEPRGLKRSAADADDLKEAAAPEAKRARMAQWILQTPRVMKSVLSRATGHLATSAATAGGSPLRGRALATPAERLRRARAASAAAARAAASGVGSTLSSFKGSLRTATTWAVASPHLNTTLAILGHGLRAWAAKDAQGLCDGPCCVPKGSDGKAGEAAADEGGPATKELPAQAPLSRVARAGKALRLTSAFSANRQCKDGELCADQSCREHEQGQAFPAGVPSLPEDVPAPPAAASAQRRRASLRRTQVEALPEGVPALPEDVPAMFADATAAPDVASAASEDSSELSAPEELEPTVAVTDGYEGAEAAEVPAAAAESAVEAPLAVAPTPVVVVAAYPYDGTAAYGEGYLDLQVGDQIFALSGDVQGWAYGQLAQPAGRAQEIGWFPAAYATPSLPAHVVAAA